MEAVRLRVKDIDFDYCCIRVWNGKGGKHRTVTLAPELKPELHAQVTKVDGYLHLGLSRPKSPGTLPPIMRQFHCGTGVALRRIVMLLNIAARSGNASFDASQGSGRGKAGEGADLL